MSINTISKFGFRSFFSFLYVLVIFLGIDILYYGWLAPKFGWITPVTPYWEDFLSKLIWSIIFALAFTAIYNHAAIIWRPTVGGNPEKKHRYLNSVLFSLVVFALILSAIALSCHMVSVLYIYLLDGIRGMPPHTPDGIADDIVLGGQIVASGLALEYHGRDETTDGREGLTP